jgi:alanine dehydrogenase
MKLGILREGKMPRDKRVPFSPAQCVLLQREFGIELIVQPSEWRIFSDDEYKAAGVKLQEDISDCLTNLLPAKNIFSFLIQLKSSRTTRS